MVLKERDGVRPQAELWQGGVGSYYSKGMGRIIDTGYPNLRFNLTLFLERSLFERITQTCLRFDHPYKRIIGIILASSPIPPVLRTSNYLLEVLCQRVKRSRPLHQELPRIYSLLQRIKSLNSIFFRCKGGHSSVNFHKMDNKQ